MTIPLIEFLEQSNSLPLVLIGLALPILPNMWAIWHAYMHQFPTPAERLGWMGLNVFVPVLGGVLYLLFGFRRSRKFGCAPVQPAQPAQQEEPAQSVQPVQQGNAEKPKAE